LKKVKSKSGDGFLIDTSTVALYRNTNGQYAIVTKITSDYDSDYNSDRSLSYHYDPDKSFESYAFPTVIGVKRY